LTKKEENQLSLPDVSFVYSLGRKIGKIFHHYVSAIQTNGPIQNRPPEAHIPHIEK
jgi:hypothetical protein